MNFYKIDAWDMYVDGFSIYDSNTLLLTLYFSQSDYPNTYLCGNTHVDAIKNVNLTFSHTQQILDLTFQDTINSALDTKSYGFRDLLISVLKCDISCFSCDGPLNTQCLNCYPFAGWHSNNHTCVCNKGFFSFYNLNQSEICNVMPCTTCQICHQTCSTCQGFGENNCTSCYTPNILVNGTCISPISNNFILFLLYKKYILLNLLNFFHKKKVI